ncbi:trithorax group protein osa-like [Panicum miliaceum]|uniref:Trithorax group protein osa-like n=1 Tax=Panicum miliaceum TaxID=4540 RepID=A0A3L6T626_PANMI|nr:trithorax group protein osa-like [Panicum miliaceum]
MVHQGREDMGHFTASFPTPTTIGAQAIQAPFQANGSEPFSGSRFPWSGHPGLSNTLVPPAVAPQTFQPESHLHRCWTMPQAGVPNASPFQHFTGAAVQPLPHRHSEELAARVAAININILTSPPFQPNNYTHGWPPPPPPPPSQQQQAPPAPRYPTLQPVGPGDGAVWGVPLPPPQDAHFHQWPTVDMAPNGSGPAQRQPGGESSWAHQEQRPGVPAAPPASGSTQAHAPVSGKTFEELLMEAGIVDDWAVDDMFVDDLIDDLLGPEAVRGGPVVSLGGGGGLPPPPPGAAGSSSDPSRGQVSLRMVRAWEEEEEEEPVGSAVGGCGRGPEAAAEARARRRRRMAKRKEAIARARPGN